MQSFIMNSHEVFIHIHQGCFAGTGAIVRLSLCQWSKPDGYGKISQCITTTKHSKAKTVCIFLGIYCTFYWLEPIRRMIPAARIWRGFHCISFIFKQNWWLPLFVFIGHSHDTFPHMRWLQKKHYRDQTDPIVLKCGRDPVCKMSISLASAKTLP